MCVAVRNRGLHIGSSAYSMSILNFLALADRYATGI